MRKEGKSVTDRSGASGAGCWQHSAPPPPQGQPREPPAPGPLGRSQIYCVGPGRGRPRPPDRCSSQKTTRQIHRKVDKLCWWQEGPQGAHELQAGGREGGHSTASGPAAGAPLPTIRTGGCTPALKGARIPGMGIRAAHGKGGHAPGGVTGHLRGPGPGRTRASPGDSFFFFKLGVPAKVQGI